MTSEWLRVRPRPKWSLDLLQSVLYHTVTPGYTGSAIASCRASLQTGTGFFILTILCLTDGKSL